MNILFIYVLFFLIIHTHCSKYLNLNDKKDSVEYISNNDNSIDEELHRNNIKPVVKGIAGTNLTTSAIYCIKERSGKYLGWNNKSDDMGRLYGLGLKSDVNCSTNTAYWFELEVKGNSLRIKNRETKKYISYYTGNFCLANNRILDINIKLVVQPDDWLNLYNNNETIYMSAKNMIKDSVYMNYGTRYFWEVGYWKFIHLSNLAEEEEEEVESQNCSDSHNLRLSVKIDSFKYETPDDNVVQNKTSRLSILSNTLVNNSSRITITHQISNQQVIRDSYQWVFNQNLDHFYRVLIDRDLPPIVTQKSGFNSIDSDVLQTINYLKHKIYSYGSVYSFERSITLPPNSAVEVNAYFEKVIDLEIAFIAKAEIKASSIGVSGQEIALYMNNSGYNFPILSISHNSITTKIEGLLVSTFGVKSYFNVIDV